MNLVSRMINLLKKNEKKPTNLNYKRSKFIGNRNDPHTIINYVNKSLMVYFLKLRMFSRSVEVSRVAFDADKLRLDCIEPLAAEGALFLNKYATKSSRNHL